MQGALDKAHADRKAAEENAAKAQRKQQNEREARQLRAQLESLEEELERKREEAGQLAVLSAKIESAKSVGDLFSS